MSEAAVDAAARSADRRESSRDVGRLRRPIRPTLNPFVLHAFLKALEDVRTVGGRSGWLPQHLVLEDAAGQVLGVAPGLRQEPQPGRIHLRPRLGRRLRARRRQLLPQAAAAPCRSRRCRAADCWSAPGAERATSTRRCWPAARSSWPSGRGVVAAHHVHHGRRMARGRASSASCSAPASSSTGRTRSTRPTTISWRRSPRASARPCARSAQQALTPASTIEWVSGRDITEAHWDAFFAFYMDTGTASGAGPISTAASSRCSAQRWPTTAC